MRLLYRLAFTVFALWAFEARSVAKDSNDLPPLPPRPGYVAPKSEPIVLADTTTEVYFHRRSRRNKQRGNLTYSSDELIVWFKDTVKKSEIKEFLRNLGCEMIAYQRSSGAYLIALPFPMDADSFVADAFYNTPLVSMVSPNLYGEVAGDTPRDELFIQQWNLANIGMIEAYSRSRGGGIWIAIFDTGIYSEHNDFALKIPRNINTGVLFGHQNTLSSVNYANPPVATPDPDYDGSGPWVAKSAQDLNGHGSFVAGIAAGNTVFGANGLYSGSGTAGVSPDSNILPIKVVNKYGRQYYYNWISGIDFVCGFPEAKVANFSLITGTNLSVGGNIPNNSGDMDALVAGMQKLRMNGRVIVAAVGNDAQNNNRGAELNYPAAWWGTIGVAATGLRLERSTYSNFGHHVSVAAPGGNDNTLFPGITYYNGYGIFNHLPSSPQQTSLPGRGRGTSFAAPHVSGLAALILSEFPTMKPGDVKYWIEDTADDVNTRSKPGFDTELGWGQINADKATQYKYAFHSFQPVNVPHPVQLISISGWPKGLSVNEGPGVRQNDLDVLFPRSGLTPQKVTWYDPAMNGGTGGFRDYQDTATPRFGAGRGYFVELYNSTGKEYEAAIAFSNLKGHGPIPAPEGKHPVPIHMTKGFNMIGIPGDRPVVFDHDSIRVRSGDRNGIVQVKSFREASTGANPWVSVHPSRWNATNKVYEQVNHGDVIYPKQGMMLQVHAKDGDPDIELLVTNNYRSRDYPEADLPTATMQWAANTLPFNTGTSQVDRLAVDNTRPEQYMQYGPYTTEVPVGNNTVEWELLINDPAPSHGAICRLDVYDATTDTVIVARNYWRTDWQTPGTFEKKALSFTIGADRAGHLFEFRTYWYNASPNTYLALQTVRLKHY